MKFQTSILFMIVAAGCVLFSGCSGKNNKADAGAHSAIAADSICYQRHVAPLLNSRCAPCHIGQTTGGIRFETYEAAKSLIGAIIVETESGHMPKGGPALGAAQVDTLRAWKQNGLKVCGF